MDRQDLSATLNRLYDYMRESQNKLSTIQNWCLTVWLATLTAGASPQLQLRPVQRLALPLLAVGLFWLLAAFQFMFVELAMERASRLEQLLVDGGIESIRPEETMFVLGSAAIPTTRKWRALIRALFLRETVTSYFGLLIAATISFHFLLR